MFSNLQVLKLFQAAQEGRLVIFDYPYSPAQRTHKGKPSNEKLINILNKNFEGYFHFLGEIEALKEDVGRIDLIGDPSGIEPYWRNEWFTNFDALSLYTLIRTRKPKIYLEVGSGNSTKFARRAIRDGGLSTQIVSVDPFPRAEINQICDVSIRQPLEKLEETDLLKYLSSGDIVFIDNSHRSFQSSDVTVFFTEILPILPAGTIYGIHDIFLPNDYPHEWLSRFYNEQYLLLSYIYGGCGGDQIIFPAYYVGTHPDLSSRCDDMLNYWEQKGIRLGGGQIRPPSPTFGHSSCFWLQRP